MNSYKKIANITSSVSKDSTNINLPAYQLFWESSEITTWGIFWIGEDKKLSLQEACNPGEKDILGTIASSAREFSWRLPIDDSKFWEWILPDKGGGSLLWSITTCSWHRHDQTTASNCKIQYMVALKLLIHWNNKQNACFKALLFKLFKCLF